MKIRMVLVAMIFLLAGCSSIMATFKHDFNIEQLSMENRVSLKEILEKESLETISVEVASKPEDAKEAELLKKMLIDELIKSSDLLTLAGMRVVETGGDLEINLKILELKRKSSWDRFFGGIFTGRASIAVETEILLKKKMMDRFLIEAKAPEITPLYGIHGSVMSGYAGTTERALEEVSVQITSILFTGKPTDEEWTMERFKEIERRDSQKMLKELEKLQ